MIRFSIAIACALSATAFLHSARASEPSSVIPVWPSDPPKWNAPSGEEHDSSGPDGRTVAGRSVIRLTNVTRPELHVYPAKGSDTTVIICPGGGFSILAWDLEGTEVAEWLQQQGVNAAVLKYRVPTRDEDERWLAPVQDLQRSLALVRDGKIPELKAKHVGVMGFSAGGHTAARSTFAAERTYEPVDKSDSASIHPDFAALIYTAYLTVSRESEVMTDGFSVTENTPPIFFAHAFDDRITPIGCVKLFAELKRNNVPASLHVFSTGGHGFGARKTDEEKDVWLGLFRSWLTDRGFN